MQRGWTPWGFSEKLGKALGREIVSPGEEEEAEEGHFSPPSYLEEAVAGLQLGRCVGASLAAAARSPHAGAY